MHTVNSIEFIITVCEGFIWQISRPSLNRKNKYPANIIHVPRQLTRPKLTANINSREHGFVSKTQTLFSTNINEFTVIMEQKMAIMQSQFAHSTKNYMFCYGQEI